MLRVLAIGVGSIGERHVRCMLATGRVQAGICETNDTLRESISRRYSIGEAFPSLDLALDQPWDAAVVATPAPSHVAIAQRLAERGIALLIEKPLATSLQGVPELLATVEARRLPAAVGYVLRADLCLVAMRQAVVSGRFGRPVQLAVTAGQHFPTFRPAYRSIYYTDRAQGGGAIQDAMTHYLNAGEWLLGPINRIVADASHQVLEGVTVEDTVHCLARHGAAMASYAMNQHQAPNELTFTVVCERGTARWEYHEQRWRWKVHPDGSPEGGAWHDESKQHEERDEWFTRQEQAFLDYVQGKAPPLCSLAEGVQTLKVNLAALRSAFADGGWQTVGD